MDADTANLVEVDNFLLAEKGKKKINIGPIGLNCIVSQSLFSDKIIKKERLGREKLRGGWLRGDDQRSVTGFTTLTPGGNPAPGVVFSKKPTPCAYG